MPPSFYLQDTIFIAKALLGTFLVHHSADGTAAGKIVETEAYLSAGDLAAHSARGQTKRNTVMFGPPGHAYIYFTYGMHWLLNVVTSPVGTGEAVLIRALEPVDGLALMEVRRRLTNPKQLCNGPAKLVQALGINPEQNGADLSSGTLTIKAKYPGQQTINRPTITTATRIGIKQSADLPLRFYLKDNTFVSRL